jgi:hypothetical protein
VPDDEQCCRTLLFFQKFQYIVSKALVSPCIPKRLEALRVQDPYRHAGAGSQLWHSLAQSGNGLSDLVGIGVLDFRHHDFQFRIISELIKHLPQSLAYLTDLGQTFGR